jgi:hypothetical protein
MSLPVSLLPPVPLRSRLFSFHALFNPVQMYHIAKTMPLTLYNGINGLVSLSGTSLLPGAFCLKPGPPWGPSEAGTSSCALARLEAVTQISRIRMDNKIGEIERLYAKERTHQDVHSRPQGTLRRMSLIACTESSVRRSCSECD